MKLTNEQIEQILANAPDGATHFCVLQYDFTEVYIRINDASTYTLDTDGILWRYVKDLELDGMYSIHNLSDLQEILTLRKRVEELEAQVPKWISLEERLPEYGASVLLKIDGVVQHVTYMRDGSDISADWFEPFHYQDDEAALFISDSVDIEWMPLPQPPKE